MNAYIKSIWALAISMAAVAITFVSPLFGIITGIVGIALSKRCLKETRSKVTYIGFWIGVAAIALGIAFWIIGIIMLV